MPEFSTRRRVRHSGTDMFDLVADMESYPQFVPLCRDLKVSQRREVSEGVETAMSEMTVAYKLIRETFVTKVTLDRPKLQIIVDHLHGPFSHLKNRWTFKDRGDGTSDVSFYISYEFSSRVLALVMGAMFDLAFRRFADAFERRADQVYGKKKIA
jgi:coenzyme Q-binding protein COQ10